MPFFNNVAVFGKGAVGTAAVEQLAQAGFAITIFTRQPPSAIATTTTNNNNIKVVQTDYASAQALAPLLKGHSAAICALSLQAALSPVQRTIIDACVLAGVKRYIPGDYGSYTHDPQALAELPFLRPQAASHEYLEGKAAAGEIEYTRLATGAILDVVLDHPFFLDLAARKAALFDLGNHPVSTSRLATVGKAMAAVLGEEGTTAATRNRTVFVHDALVTQAQLLGMARRHSGDDGKEWTIGYIDGGAEYAAALAAQKAGDMGQQSIFRVVVAALMTGRFKGAYVQTDNELLRLGFMKPDEIEAMVAARCRK